MNPLRRKSGGTRWGLFQIDSSTSNDLHNEYSVAGLNVIQLLYAYVRRYRTYSDCTFIVPKSCYRKALTIGLDDERIIIATPGVSFSLNGMHINPVRAIHGHYQGSVYGGASMGDCGYVISSGGFTLYQPGDTLLLAEHFEMDGIDLLFFSPTEHNTHIENSIRLIRLLRPGRIIPQHFDSYVTTPDNAFWTKGYPDEVYAMLTDTEKRAFMKLSQGRPARADWGS